MSNRRKNKREVKQIIADNFTVGQKFKANELSEYTDLPTWTIGRYLAQFPNIKIIPPAKKTGRNQPRVYEVIE